MRYLRWLVVMVGVPLGLWHWSLAARAIFVFREGEPFSSWIAVGTGLVATLPLVLVSIWRAKWAACGLAIAAVLSAGATILGVPPDELPGLLLGLAKVTSGPMLLMSGVLLWVAHTSKQNVERPSGP